MEKFLEVNENNLNNKNLITGWIAECQHYSKPCIIIYYDDQLAQITASLRHLSKDKDIKIHLDEKELDKAFFFLGIKYFQNTLHFYKYDHELFTFNDVEKELAKQAAFEIYFTFEKLMSIKPKIENY